jgi:valyl-tRNA synthetase
VGLPVINIMNKDGSLNANAGAYAGMDRFAVRQQLWADMESQGLALKAEPYTLKVPRSQRGGEVRERASRAREAQWQLENTSTDRGQGQLAVADYLLF